MIEQFPIDLEGGVDSAPVSLSSILTAGLGPSWAGYPEFWIAYYGASWLADNVPLALSYWDPAQPSVQEWLYNGVDIGASTNASFEQKFLTASQATNAALQLGNDIEPTVYLTVPISLGAGIPTTYIQYNINVVAPALQGTPHGVDGEPTPTDIVDAAQRFAAAYGGVLNDFDCHGIAGDIAAAAGATFDADVTASTDPARNRSAGFWRIVYRGSDPGTVTNWQALVQPGDIVRMAWSTTDGAHTTTVLSVNGDGTLTVMDNAGVNAEGQSIIGIHTANYAMQTLPGSITIYRLTTDHLYLIDGSDQSEILNGSYIYDSEIATGAGNDVVNCGPNRDVVELGNGNKTINGGAGYDTVAFPVSTSAVQLTDSEGNPLNIVSGEVQRPSSGPMLASWSANSDTLNGIAALEFTDRTLLVAPSCFVEGTRLAMAVGAKEVERLKVGDVAETLLGGSGRIVWVGSWTIDCARYRDPEAMWPVLIVAGAFGIGVPARDLYVSQDHALYVDGVLIPARYLLNGTAVRRIARKQVTYWHVELERHDVVLAEGLAAESYLDVGDRADFDGGSVPAQHLDLRGADRCSDAAARVWEAKACAPLVMSGPVLEAVRQRIARRSYGRGALRAA